MDDLAENSPGTAPINLPEVKNELGLIVCCRSAGNRLGNRDEVFSWLYPDLAFTYCHRLHVCQFYVTGFGNAINSFGDSLCCLDRDRCCWNRDLWYDFSGRVFIRLSYSLSDTYFDRHRWAQAAWSQIKSDVFPEIGRIRVYGPIIVMV